jgi:hypothetical protein
MDTERVMTVPLPAEENIFLFASYSFYSASSSVISELINYNHIMLDKQNNSKHLWSAKNIWKSTMFLGLGRSSMFPVSRYVLI